MFEDAWNRKTKPVQSYSFEGGFSLNINDVLFKVWNIYTVEILKVSDIMQHFY